MPSQAKKQAKQAARKTKQSKEQLTIAILEKARQLVAKGWTKINASVNKRGEAVWFADPAACKFCAYGALLRAHFDLTGTTEPKNTDDIHPEPVEAAERALGLYGGELFNFNDSAKSKKAVLALFDSAIQRLEAQA